MNFSPIIIMFVPLDVQIIFDGVHNHDNIGR